MSDEMKLVEKKLLSFETDGGKLVTKGSLMSELYRAKAGQSGIFTSVQGENIRDFLCQTNDHLSGKELSDEAKSEFVEFEILGLDEGDTIEEQKRLSRRQRDWKRTVYNLKPSLYSSSAAQRDRILKTMKLDDVTRMNIEKENLSLEEVLHTYQTKKERVKLAKKGKDFFNTFMHMRKELDKNPFLTAEDKAKRLYHLAKPYEKAIVMYREEYFENLEETNRKADIEELLDRLSRLYDLYSGEENENREEKDRLLNDMKLKGSERDLKKELITHAREVDNSEAIEKSSDADKTLSAEQVEGIYRIDQYVVSNLNKGKSNSAFIEKLLSLPLRSRLLVYGAIEMGRLNGTLTPAHVALTQISYIPNKTAFANKMSRLPGFMWAGSKRKKLAKKLNSFHEERLEEAMALLDIKDVVSTMEAFSHIRMENEDTFDILNSAEALQEQKEKQRKQAQQNQQELQEQQEQHEQHEQQNQQEAQEQPLEDQNLTAMSTALTAKEADRNKKLMDAIRALEECRSAMEEADNAVFKKKSKSAIADEKSKKAKDLFDEMLEADRELASLKIDIHLRIGIAAGDEDFEWLEKSAVIGDKQRDEADHLDTKQLDNSKLKAVRATTGQKIMKGAAGASVAVSQATLLASKVDKVYCFHTGAEKAPANFGISSGAFTSLTGVVGLMGALIGTVKLMSTVIKNGDDLSLSTVTNATLQNARGVYGSAWAIGAGGFQIGLSVMGAKAAAMAAAGDAAAQSLAATLETAGSALATATAVVSGAKLAVDAVDGVVQAKDWINHGIAWHRVKKLKNKGTLTGREADYADNILSIDRRNKTTAALKTVDSICLNGAGILVALFAGPFGAFAYAGASVLNTVAVKVIEHYKKKEDHRKLVDEFFGLDDLMKEMVPNREELSQKENDRLRELMRNEMAAELGFNNIESMTRHVISNYSMFIYDKLFYKDGDKEQPYLKQDEEKGRLSETSRAFLKMVRMLGLKVRFPEQKGDDAHPTLQMIAQKLMG